MAQRRFQSVLVVVAHCGDYRVALSRWDLERSDLGLTHRAGSETGQLRDLDHGARSRAVPEHNEQRLGQSRLDEDVERAAAGTGGRDHQLALFAGLFDLVGANDVDQLRRAFGQRPQRFAPHYGLGAAAADPTAQAPVGRDDRLVTGAR